MGAYLDSLVAARAARQERMGARSGAPPAAAAERASEAVLAAGMKANDLSLRLDAVVAKLANLRVRLDAAERRLALVADALADLSKNGGESADKTQAAAAVATLSVPRLRDIKQAVCRAYGFGLAELDGEKRFGRIVRARHVAMYLVRELAGSSLSEIGALFGGRDHTTALYACKRIAKDRARDAKLDAELSALAAQIRR